jgi:hypothetical protein
MKRNSGSGASKKRATTVRSAAPHRRSDLIAEMAVERTESKKRAAEALRNGVAAKAESYPPSFHGGNVESLLAPLIDEDELADFIDTIAGIVDVYRMNIAASKSNNLPPHAKTSAQRRAILRRLAGAIDRLGVTLKSAEFIGDMHDVERLRIAVESARPWRETVLEQMVAEKIRHGPPGVEDRAWLIPQLAREFTARTGLPARVGADRGDVTDYTGPFFELVRTVLPEYGDAAVAKAIQTALEE